MAKRTFSDEHRRKLSEARQRFKASGVEPVRWIAAGPDTRFVYETRQVVKKLSFFNKQMASMLQSVLDRGCVMNDETLNRKIVKATKMIHSTKTGSVENLFYAALFSAAVHELTRRQR